MTDGPRSLFQISLPNDARSPTLRRRLMTTIPPLERLRLLVWTLYGFSNDVRNGEVPSINTEFSRCRFIGDHVELIVRLVRSVELPCDLPKGVDHHTALDAP